MAFTDRILNTFGLATRKQFNEAVKEALSRELDWLGETADAQRWDVPDPMIYANQADMYRLSPLLGTALDVLADDVGLSKFEVYRLAGEDKREIPNHEFEVLLRTPNEMNSGLEFMRDTTMSYKLNGNAIWWLNRAGPYDRPSELWSIPFEMVKPVPDKRLAVSHYEYYPGYGKPAIIFPTWQILHFKTYNPRSYFWGLSPIESLAMTLAGNQGMRKTKATTYTNYNGQPPSILAFKDWINDEAWNEIKRKADESAKKNQMMKLRGVGDTVTWMSRVMSNKDAEFIASLEQDMIDVFNRMTPGLLAMLDTGAAEANALAARATYSEKSLWKTLETFAQKITSNILPVYETRWKLTGEFEDPRVVDRKLELEEQAAFERTHTIEEVRKEKYGDKPLGDERDNLFVSEIRVASSYGATNEPPPPSDNNPENTDNITNMADTRENAGDTSIKAVADLKRWRTLTQRKGTEKALDFTSDYISPQLVGSIKASLMGANGRREISVIFNNAIKTIEPVLDPNYLVNSIEQGVMALEKVK